MKKNNFLKAAASLLLAATMLTSLVACGSGETSTVTKRTHDQTTHVITGKGGTIQHNFVNGKCTMCDETTVYRQDPIYKTPDLLNTTASKQGSVEYFWYKTRAYGVEERLKNEKREHAGEELWIYKRAFVYLPAGYNKEDTSKKYNVVYMMHGNGLNEGYWFRTGAYAPESAWSIYTGGYGTNNMLDHMKEDGLMEDTIFVAMTMYQYYEGEKPENPDEPNYIGGDTGGQSNIYSGYVAPENDLGFRTGQGTDNEGIDSVYWKEWQYHLMPYVVEHYNTYAKSTSEEDMKAARDHVGFTGLSRGGASVGSVLANSLEYISYFCYESGGQPGAEQIANIKAKKDTYPVKYILVSCGSQEGPEKSDAAVLGVRDQLGWTDGSDISNGDQIAYIQVNGTAHNYATWITNLYNFMLVAFKK